MAIIKWTPNQMWDDVDRMFDEMWMPVMRMPRFAPAVDVYEDTDNVIVETPLAGVDPNQVTITVEDNILKIDGRMEKKSEVDEKNYYRKEIRSGEFFRAVALPRPVVGDKADATFEKGVLKVIIPKAEEAKPKQVKVKITGT